MEFIVHNQVYPMPAKFIFIILGSLGQVYIRVDSKLVNDGVLPFTEGHCILHQNRYQSNLILPAIYQAQMVAAFSEVIKTSLLCIDALPKIP